jgi:tetrahydromethanopterin S-methyltransferase subunit F
MPEGDDFFRENMAPAGFVASTRRAVRSWCRERLACGVVVDAPLPPGVRRIDTMAEWWHARVGLTLRARGTAAPAGQRRHEDQRSTLAVAHAMYAHQLTSGVSSPRTAGSLCGACCRTVAANETVTMGVMVRPRLSHFVNECHTAGSHLHAIVAVTSKVGLNQKAVRSPPSRSLAIFHAPSRR